MCFCNATHSAGWMLAGPVGGGLRSAARQQAATWIQRGDNVIASSDKWKLHFAEGFPPNMASWEGREGGNLKSGGGALLRPSMVPPAKRVIYLIKILAEQIVALGMGVRGLQSRLNG